MAIKAYLILIVLTFMTFGETTAQIGIGTTTPDTSAILDVNSTTKGFLLPRMTTTERDAIVSPASGLIIFNTTISQLDFYNGTTWLKINDNSDSVDLTTNQTIAGIKTFTSDLTVEGRLLIPMGEVSYFNFSGYTVSIPLKALGASGTDNMVLINPSTGVVFINDCFGTSANSRLTYTGAVGRYFHIALSFSYTPGTSGDVFVFGVARNGTVEDSSKVFIKTRGTNDHESSAMHTLLWLAPNEYLEFFVGNTQVAGSSIDIKTFNFVAIGM